MKNYHIYFYLFLLLAILTLFSHLMLPDHPFYYTKYMHLGYISASENIFGFNEAPYSWRLLQPLIINILPFQYTVSFFLLAFSSLYFTSIILFKIFNKIYADINLAFTGAVLFLSLVWAVRFNIIEFWYPESLLYFFIALSVYFTYTSKKILLSITLLLGLLTKESMLLFIPLYYFVHSGKNLFKKFDTKLFKETLKISILPLLVYLIIRIIINGHPIQYYGDWLGIVLERRILIFLGIVSSLKHDLLIDQPWYLTFSINWYRITLGTFGGIIIFFLLKIKESKSIIISYSLILIGTYLQLFLAYDIERLLTIAFFPVILLTIHSFKYYANKFGINKLYFLAYALILFSIQMFFVTGFYYETFYAVFTQTVFSILFFAFLIYRNHPVTSIFITSRKAAQKRKDR